MDSEGVQAFAASHEAALLRYAFLLTGSHSDAEDLVQTAFLRLLQGRERQVRTLAPYVKRMVYHEFCSRLRRKEAPASDPALESPAFEHDIVQRQWMWGELATLSPRQRAALVLRYYEGLPDNEIAGILRCRRTTVRSLVARALSELRQRHDDAELDPTTAPDEQRTQP